MSQTSSLTAWIAAAIIGLVLIAFSPYVRAADQHAIFALVLNQVTKGDIIAIIRPKDILVPVKTLEDAGLQKIAGKREKIGGKEFVSLASLAPEIKYELDLTRVELRLTAQPSLLGGGNVVDLRILRPPAGIVYSHNPSFFLNYGVNLSNFNTVGTAFDAGLSVFGNALFESTFNLDPTGTLSRGISTLTIDDRQDLRRLQIGDVSVAAPFSQLGGNALVGGVNFSRDFGLDPYAITTPQGTFTGAVTTPSTIEVYVNGQLIRREPLPPGIFTLQDIPFFQGSGNTRVIVRDAFGREQEFGSSYYLFPTALGKGLSDYTVSFGPVRQNLGVSNWGYGKFVFDAAGRYGLTDWFTPGLRFEGDENIFSGGTDMTFGTPVGGITLSGAASRAAMNETTQGSVNFVPVGGRPGAGVPSVGTGSGAQVMGYAGALSLSYFGQTWGLGGQISYYSPHYANISLAPSDDRATVQAMLSGSYTLSERTTLVPEASYTKMRDGSEQESAAVTVDVRITKGLVFFADVGASKDTGSSLATNAFLGLSYALASNTVLTGTFQRTDGGQPSSRGNGYGVQLQQSPPLGPGFGYVLQEQEQPGSSQQIAQLFDHGNHGFYEFDYDRNAGQNSYQFNFSGSLDAVGGRLFSGPPVQASFAVIRTPEIPNVEGYLYHQLVGRTDSRGDLLVPQLVAPYYANNFSINDQDIPINYRIDSTSEIVAPPFRGGAIVTFPIRRIRSFIGKLVVQVAGKTVIPAFGTLTMMANGKTFSSPIGHNGEFFLDSPPTGTFPATIDFEKGLCHFSINVHDGAASFVKLGTLRCTM